MATLVTLKEFSPNELFLDNDETKRILEFFFENQKNTIKDLIISDRIRGFAQGLLVEAIDASYAMGFIEALFKATTNPRNGAGKIIKKFAKSAFKHWFKHATASDLLNVKIYETVRLQLSINFGRHFIALRSGLVKNGKIAAFVAYEENSTLANIIWG
jgi:hypothetical protein